MTNPTFKPVCRQKDLIIGTGRAIIVTGWTPKEVVAKKLEPHHYAVIGNLYSSRYGITPFLVNLIANPYNWDIFLLNATAQDRISNSCQDLWNLLVYGSEALMQLQGAYKRFYRAGFLHEALPKDLVHKAIYNLHYRSYQASLDKVIEEIHDYYGFCYDKSSKDYDSIGDKPLVQYAKPIVTTIPEPKGDHLPGRLIGHVVEDENVAETWLKAIHLIRSTGKMTDSAYSKRQELINLTSVIHSEPEDLHFEPFMPVTREYMTEYLKSFLDHEVPDGTAYTYGSRMAGWHYSGPLRPKSLEEVKMTHVDQIADNCYRLLCDPDSTRCVVDLWKLPEDIYNNNPPCLNHIWLRVVDEQLILVATFRSHDIYSAFPSNVMGLRKLQQAIVDSLSKGSISRQPLIVDPGPIVVNSLSAHIYEHSFQHVDDCLKDYVYQKVTYNDPVGNFILTMEDEITITQTDPSGTPVKVYKGKDPLKLLRKIAFHNPEINPIHLGYLGIELQKASQQGKEYNQDQR